MTMISTARRARTMAAAVAGAALLSLSACGGSAEDPGTAEATVEASDGGSDTGSDSGSDAESDGRSDAESDGDSDAGSESGSDGGSEQDDASDAGADTGSDSKSDDSGSDQDEASDGGQSDDGDTAQQGTRILLVTDPSSDDGSGDGWPVLSQEELAALLAAPFDGTATCDGELELAPRESTSCRGPASWDATDPEQEWTAQSARVPSAGHFGDGGSVAVLFTTGSGLSGPADVLLDEGTELTGLGFGSMFGAEDLSAEELEDSTQQVLTSENAYVPVGDAGWESVTCSDGLSFDTVEPTPCSAGTADGETYTLQVAPGTYADNDQGLLVGIVRNDAD